MPRSMILLALTVLSTQLSAQVISLDLNYLKELSKKSAPMTDAQEMKTQAALAGYHQLETKYQLYGYGGAEVSETRERPVNAFAPVQTNAYMHYFGLKKELGLGMGLDLNHSFSSFDNNIAGSETPGRIATTSLNLEVDLWKNFLGRVDRAQRNHLEANTELETLRSDIEQKRYLVELRRAFYKLVSVSESMAVASELEKLARKQLEEVNKRFKVSDADRGEVARYRALHSSRKSLLTQFEFQRTQVVKYLQDLAPSLKGRELQVGNFNLATEVDRGLACIQVIKSQRQTPLHFTRLDEALQKVNQSLNYKKDSLETYGDVDLKLTGSIFSKGVAQDSSTAYEQSLEEGRFGESLGVSLTIPIGSDSSKEEKARIRLAEIENRMEQNKTVSALDNRHQFTIRAIDYLLESIDLQKINNENLKIRLDDMKKKYRQGRVSITEMIYDQDALLNSELQILEIRDLIVDALLDYVKDFEQTQCAFNEV